MSSFIPFICPSIHHEEVNFVFRKWPIQLAFLHRILFRIVLFSSIRLHRILEKILGISWIYTVQIWNSSVPNILLRSVHECSCQKSDWMNWFPFVSAESAGSKIRYKNKKESIKRLNSPRAIFIRFFFFLIRIDERRSEVGVLIGCIHSKANQKFKSDNQTLFFRFPARESMTSWKSMTRGNVRGFLSDLETSRIKSCGWGKRRKKRESGCFRLFKRKWNSMSPFYFQKFERTLAIILKSTRAKREKN